MGPGHSGATFTCHYRANPARHADLTGPPHAPPHPPILLKVPVEVKGILSICQKNPALSILFHLPTPSNASPKCPSLTGQRCLQTWLTKVTLGAHPGSPRPAELDGPLPAPHPSSGQQAGSGAGVRWGERLAGGGLSLWGWSAVPVPPAPRDPALPASISHTDGNEWGHIGGTPQTGQ